MLKEEEKILNEIVTQVEKSYWCDSAEIRGRGVDVQISGTFSPSDLEELWGFARNNGMLAYLDIYEHKQLMRIHL